MRAFDAALDELAVRADPRSVLDVGCGDGTVARRWCERLDARVVGVDLPSPRLRARWEAERRGNLELRAADARALPFADGEFELVAAVESLEHIRDPARALAEMARVARAHLLVSVPREPLWRAANLARGAYLPSLGNTPGHVNHWSGRALLSLVEPYGAVEAKRCPFPWSIVLVRTGGPVP